MRVRVAPYVEFAKKAFAREATYRMEVLTEIGSLVLRVYILRSLWTALYAQNAAPINLPLHGMITYATVAMLMSLILEVDGTRLIREKVREGTIATDLMKPISVPLYFFSDGIGQTLLHAVLVVPSLFCALLLVRIDVPSPATIAAFALSFVIGYGVNFFLNFLMNSIAFWTLETFAAQLIVRWASDLLSGQIIPLTLFPGIFGRIVFGLPFAAIYSTPLLIYVGVIPSSQWALSIALQAVWLVAFAAIASVVWRAASNRVIVQGG
ncbi:MAG: ABC-2 family transporter protein [Candidatus Eremiobacteraeota bacterium]|nr:ABC-2 family transporter protein [Candidatus Eremiobacteraeota bacterium]MBV9698611.1 ABC-2 family transporter protein [Candidatus Eremiobacteraeota bacterium]